MGKLKSVTEAEIAEAITMSDDALDALQDVASRLEKGYCDDISKPSDLALKLTLQLAFLSRAASSVLIHVLAKGANQAQKRELEALLRERTKAG